MRTFAQKENATQQTESTISGCAHSRQSREVHAMLNLQRTIGNQAVSRLLDEDQGNCKVDSTITETARFGHDFSRIPVHAAIHGRSAPPVARQGDGAPSLAPVTQEVPAPPQIAPTEP